MNNCQHCGEPTEAGYSMCQSCLLKGHANKNCALCLQELEEDLRTDGGAIDRYWQKWDDANRAKPPHFIWAEAQLLGDKK